MGGEYPQPSPSPEPQPSQSAQPAQTPYVVRWVSSRTIREAAVRRAMLSGQLKQEDATKELS
ncbi:MAG: hypothetical protein WB987_00690, partial [Candidatus Acidiferrales bacterium]